MKQFYITNYAFVKVKKGVSIYVHTNENCKKLNAPYEAEDMSIPNSGIRLLEIDDKKYEYLKAYGILLKCNECNLEEMVRTHDQFIFDGTE